MPSREAKGGGQEERKLELRLAPPGEPNNHLGDGNNKEVAGLLPERSRLPPPPTTMTTTPQTRFSLDISGGKDDDDGFKKPLNTSSQKRSAPGPLVGWPPIRSFRKNNIAAAAAATTPNNNSPQKTNPSTHDHKAPPACENPTEETNGKLKGGGSMFVKINMEGVGIGRKVDLMAYDSYDKLFSAVDVLFRGLLEGQRDKGGVVGELEPINGGEYTLVYEDNEGDRMLLGDVPWIMFLSTVKRLRVIKKTSQLSSQCAGGDRHDNNPTR
ncbi:hypothetical protein MLD38_028918 [Melastoma candidum]|uniref:Uncharacterized protein n=1 Tax=Melastoma candidum TaxID=119954 RepID=A0ACB9N849_9MYRT|nr:hypothetical protein MLD38_028918 [Melastoma candidum]